MAKTSSDCFIILEMLSKKWTLKLLNSLGQKSSIRFNKFIEEHPGISPKTLSERLKELESKGVVSKKYFAEIPPRVEYSLTDKGQDLSVVFDKIKNFSSKWE